MTGIFAIVAVKTKKAIQELHVSINSKMDKLLEVSIIEALQRGHIAGTEEEKQRQALQNLDRSKGEAVGRQAEKDSVK